ncbi:hypothetical protein LZX86_004208 [Escherichia coli]|nr:hypothetical protein [Escherichia coli]HCB9632811.1 hypothetical protein [Escherichia coli]HDJ0369691.1 hypothetical protein [Escherichia coli]
MNTVKGLFPSPWLSSVSATTFFRADTGKNSRKLPLRAAGNFRITFVINTNKPEDQLFVSGIYKERNIQVCAALYDIIKGV